MAVSTAIIAGSLQHETKVIRDIVKEASPDKSVGELEEKILEALQQAEPLEAVKKLIEFSKKTNNEKNILETIYFLASRMDETTIVTYLLTEYKFPVDIRDNQDNTALMIACIHGSLAVLKVLLTAKADFRATKVEYFLTWTPFLLAARYGKLEIVKLLLRVFPELLLTVQTVELNVFMAAAFGGHEEILKFLLKKDKNFWQKTGKNGYNVFMAAAEGGHVNILIFLLSLEAEFFKKTDQNAATAFLSAARGGKLDALKFLVRCDKDCWKKTTQNGSDAFMYAAIGGHVHVLKYLQDLDKNFILKKRKDGLMAFHMAANYGQVDVLKFLISLNKDCWKKMPDNGKDSFMFAAEGGRINVLQFLLTLNKDFHKKTTPEGWSAFMIAGEQGQIETMKFLASYDQNCWRKIGSFGWNAFLLSARGGQIESMEYLLTLDRDFWKKSMDFGKNAFIWAAVNGHVKVLRYLLTIDKEYWKKSENEAFLLAAGEGKVKSLEFLLHINSQVINAADENMEAALYKTVSKNKFEAMKYLISKGAKVGVFTNRGYDEIKIAKENAETHCLDYLLLLNKLFTYVIQGDIDKVEILFIQGQSPHARNQEGDGLLHIALKYQKFDMALFLLEKGTNKHCRNDRNQAPFDEILRAGHLSFVLDLVKRMVENIKLTKDILEVTKQKRIDDLKKDFLQVIVEAEISGVELDYELLASDFDENYWVIFANKIAYQDFTTSYVDRTVEAIKSRKADHEKYKNRKNLLSNLIINRTLICSETKEGRVCFKLTLNNSESNMFATPIEEHKADRKSNLEIKESSEFSQSLLSLSLTAGSQNNASTGLAKETEAERALRLKWALKFALQASNYLDAQTYFLLLSNPKLTLPLPKNLQPQNKVLSKDEMILNMAMSLRAMHHEMDPLHDLHFDNAELEPGGELEKPQKTSGLLQFSSASDVVVTTEDRSNMGAEKSIENKRSEPV